MMEREETRNLETIPVGSLGIIPLRGCESLAQRVDQYLVRWRTQRESEHKDSLAFAWLTNRSGRFVTIKSNCHGAAGTRR